MKKLTIITFVVFAVVVTSFTLLSANKTTSTNGELVVLENTTNGTMEAFAMEDSDSF